MEKNDRVSRRYIADFVVRIHRQPGMAGVLFSKHLANSPGAFGKLPIPGRSSSGTGEQDQRKRHLLFGAVTGGPPDRSDGLACSPTWQGRMTRHDALPE